MPRIRAPESLGPAALVSPTAVPAWIAATPHPAFAFAGRLAQLSPWLVEKPPQRGVLAARLTLAMAEKIVPRLHRGSVPADLRDVHVFAGRKQDPGPAGRLYRALRAVYGAATSVERQIGPWCAAGGFAEQSGALARLVETAPGEHRLPEAPWRVCLQVAEELAAHAPEPWPRLTGALMADVVLARICRWPQPFPVLAPAFTSWPRTAWHDFVERDAVPVPFFEAGVGGLTAVQRAGADLTRAALRLIAATDQVRTKGKWQVVQKLLADDAFRAQDLIGEDGTGSDRAARRHLERLVELNGIRLLTDRPYGRLYGL